MRAARTVRPAALTAAAAAIAAALAAGARVTVTAPGAAPTALDATGVIHQRTRDDCGVAAVAMLLRAAGQDIDLAELWRSADVPRGGLSLAQLADLSARHGEAAVPFAAADTEPAAVAPPWIAHLSWNHYVLIEAAAGERLVIADPRGHRYSLPEDGFRRVWTGYGLRLAAH